MFSFKAHYANTWSALAAILLTGLFSMGCLIALTMYQLDTLLRDERYKHVQAQVLTAKHLVELMSSKPTNLSKDELKAHVLEMLSELRYPEGGYFWVLDKQGTMIMHPFSRGVVGTSTLDLLDINGKFFVHDMLVTAESGGGFVTYSWMKPNGEKHYPKVAYITPIEQWGWVLGSGSYIDDLEETTKSEVYRNTFISLCLVLINCFVLLMVSRKFINQFHNNAIKDPLTSLLNRRYLDEISTKVEEKAKLNRSPISILFFDIDHFKVINDKHGHRAGDLVLKQLGGIVNDFTRMNDLSFRYGGEEFILVLESALNEAERIANDLKALVEETPFDIGVGHIHITLSIGISTNFLDQTQSLKDLIFRSDSAMYQAKAAGRNCIRVYN